MKKNQCIPHVQTAAIIVSIFLFSLGSAFAAGAQEAEAEKAGNRFQGNRLEIPGDELPITEVALFTSGVGYFERSGMVLGNGTVTLRFPVRDIDDLLKSLIVRDLDGGRIGEIRYGARDPLSRALKSFSLDLTGKPSLAALAGQARGEEVSLTGTAAVTGIILGVEERTSPEGVKLPVLILYSKSGIRTIPFSEVETFLFTDEKLQRELEQALALIAANRNTDTRPVSIEFVGTGTREVRAAYIVETPVWKTSYRLVLGENDEHYLQGWAIVENTGEEDWNNISLSLVAGQPVSFIMELSKPLYVTRPKVSILPESSVESQLYGEAYPVLPESPVYDSMAPAPRMRSEAAVKMADRFQGVEPAAAAESAGEFFVYRASYPVTLPRQGSALVPIIGEPIEGERISIFDRNVHAERPLNGVLLKNTTGLHLMGGPVTVFEEDIYAGDARFSDIRPLGERLLSFSVDQDTRVEVEGSDVPEDITRVRIMRGSLFITRMQQKRTLYTLFSGSSGDRTVLLIHPRTSGWTLKEPSKPDETASGSYRFRVPRLPADSRQELLVTEERAVEQSISLRSIGSDTVQFYLRQNVVSDSVKNALLHVQDLSRAAAAAARSREALETEIRNIHREQERIRANMSGLDRDSALYRRYVATLTSQEDELSSLQNRLITARNNEAARRSTLEKFIESIEVE